MTHSLDSTSPFDEAHQRVIYAIVCAIEDRTYVGKSEEKDKRWASHLAMLRAGRHHCALLQAHWLVHGPDAFHFVVIEPVAEDEDIRAREKFWIDKLGSTRARFGYSLNRSQIKRLSPEQRMRGLSGAPTWFEDNATKGSEFHDAMPEHRKGKGRWQDHRSSIGPVLRFHGKIRTATI